MGVADGVAVPAPARSSLVGAFAIAVVVASVMKAPADPFAKPGPFGLVGIDKWIHVGSYALFTFLLAYAYLASRVWVLAVVLVVSVLFGGVVELLQILVPWRTTELADVLANTVGTVVALALWHVTWRQTPVETGGESGG